MREAALGPLDAKGCSVVRRCRAAMRQGRCQAGCISCESTADLEVRQGLLKFFHASVGDFGAAEFDDGEVRQPRQMRQPRIGHSGKREL